MKNPIYTLVESEIFLSQNGQSEFELIKKLERRNAFSFLSGDNNERLFRKHFLVMNALYHIKNQLMITKENNLLISPLMICVITHHAKGEPSAVSSECSDDPLLADYYLNMDNLSQTSKDIEGMLNNFWIKFNQTRPCNPQDITHSLGVLGLKSGANKADIQKAYRQLIAVHHPDKGGDKETFVSIRQAYETLSR